MAAYIDAFYKKEVYFQLNDCPESLIYWRNSLFTVDITTFHRGFHGDLNETFFVGEVADNAKKLVKTTHECLSQAIAEGIVF